ncbi:MAG: ABC transporter ATP-binding protein [Tidjanibacter sp.]|nr:ABC transporter ATP-binding protein [Tidjanibacter sp.]
MIELKNISLGYDNKQILLKDVSATFSSGTTTALIGRNGSGKSTLLRAIIGSQPLMNGNIVLNGTDIKDTTALQLARQVAFVTTERVRISNLACRDVVALGRAPYTNWIGRMQREDERVVMQSLEKVGMEAYAFRTMDKMSDGECQRVMIARALAQETPIILLDEPTSFLDMPNRYELCHLLADLAHKENKCIVFSTHELDIAKSVCDTIALIDSPTLHHYPAEEMINSGYIEKLFKIRYEK